MGARGWRAPTDDRDLGHGADEAIEEYYGQLWSIPTVCSPPARVLATNSAAINLVWIRRDLFVAKNFTADDCFPVSSTDRFAPEPIFFSFVQDFWSRIHGKATFADILKRLSMEGGRVRDREVVAVVVVVAISGRADFAILTNIIAPIRLRAWRPPWTRLRQRGRIRFQINTFGPLNRLSRRISSRTKYRWDRININSR